MKCPNGCEIKDESELRSIRLIQSRENLFHPKQNGRSRLSLMGTDVSVDPFGPEGSVVGFAFF